MKKWLIAGLCVLLAVLAAYIAAGPYLAMNGIRNVVASGDYGKLSRFVDFQKLRDNVTPQIQARITRDIQQRLGAGSAANIASSVSLEISAPVIDAIVSPLGVGTLLTGSTLARQISGTKNKDGRAHADDPLKDAKTRYVSMSRFTATVISSEGKPVVFEFERTGLGWKMTGLDLPD